MVAFKRGTPSRIGRQSHGKNDELTTSRIQDRFEGNSWLPLLLQRDSICPIFTGIVDEAAIAAERAGKKIPDLDVTGCCCGVES